MDNRTIEQVRENEDRLIKELQQKENIIKEVRELCYYESTNVESLTSDILEILDKENNE